MLWGGFVIMCGHISMAIPVTTSAFVWLGLLLIITGTGLLKPNISVMVGKLYPEDADAFGSIAVVVEKLQANGVRIHFRGTSWPAQLIRGDAEVGAKVRIIDRDNLIWIVEPISPA